MKKIIVHVGPPKTGTTSLQYYYKEVDISPKNAVYVGVFQPRQKHNKTGENNLVRDVLSYSKDPDVNMLNKIHSSFNKLFIKYDSIIISEEMLLFTENWSSRINNLHNLISKYDHELIVCLRDIRKALPSYYGEVYNNLPKVYRNSFTKFEKSKHCLIYDYTKIHENLHIFSKVNYIEFEKLINNKYSEKDLLPGIGDKTKNVVMGKQNSKKRTYQNKKVQIDINVDKYKQSIFFKKFFRLLSLLKLSRFKPFIRRMLKYDKTITIEISNHIKTIHKRNQTFLDNLNR